MRDIKFRAYIKKDYNSELVGKVLEVSSLHLKKNKAIIGYSISKSNYGNHSFNYEDIELMQYTGLYDKNGKEIYEGDIVKIKHIGKTVVAWVAYDDEDAGFVTKCKNIILHNEPLSDINMRDREVIGNVWKDSDLLSDNKNTEND